MPTIQDHVKGLRDAMVHVVEHAQALSQKLPALEADANAVLAKKAEADALTRTLADLTREVEEKRAEKDRLDKGLDKLAQDAAALLNRKK